MSDEVIKVFTYCGVNDNNGNFMAEIDSNEIKEWKKTYIKGFDESYISIGDNPLDVRNVYCDPDVTYKKGYDNQFYDQLRIFHSKRENDLRSKLNGNYEYKFVEGEGIEVSEISEDGDKKILFYLRSDQFGFSAPSNDKSHPYDLYIMKHKNKDKAIQQVADWLICSRTIGGSFLWPKPFYYKYNKDRGGKITSSRRYYIQDRVDLTLWEIYLWYKNRNKSTIMTRCNDESKSSNLSIWLDHFGDFSTYIDFFCFDDFVEKSKEEKYPKSIFADESCEPKWGKDGINPNIEITNNIDFSKLENMLKRLNDRILKRSTSIEKKINSK